MSTIAATSPEDRILEAVVADGEPLVIVPSPPGAGKTALVEALTVAALDAGLRVLVTMPRNEQVAAFLGRLTTNWLPLPVEALLASDRQLSPALRGAGVVDLPNAAAASDAAGVVLVATVSKLMMSVSDLGSYDLLICDEAWQTTTAEFFPCLPLAGQVALVGDPGQLPPVVRSDTARLEARAHRPHWPAPLELLRRFPGARTIPLESTRRLPRDTAELIQPAFYPDLPFASVAGMRRLSFAASGLGGAIDRALDQLQAGASLTAVVLPAAPALGEMDHELAQLSADVATRILERSPEWVDERTLTAADIGVVDPHRNSGTQTASILAADTRTRAVTVSTPEVWQGSERPLIVARHPLVAGRRLGPFDLDPGRFCVATSRHQLGCVIVARDDLSEAIERHRHDVAEHAAGAADGQYEGWLAHRSLWRALEERDRVHRL